MTTRIGIVGYGYIGQYIYEQITTRPELGLEIAFVHNRTMAKLEVLPPDLALEDLGAFAARGADLIVELAHPDITRTYGVAFLQNGDYMPLSLTALSDAQLEQALLGAARENATCLYIPHGAVVGLDALEEGRQMWDAVTITMKKPLNSLDFSVASHIDPETISGAAVLYDGDARGICPLFPRNVNSHAAVALAGIGFDRTRSVLIADPGLTDSIIEVEAHGQGVELQVKRTNPMQGVSGVFTLVSMLASIGRAKAQRAGLRVC
jgi:predicted dinucleotide-utilizing enzyme